MAVNSFRAFGALRPLLLRARVSEISVKMFLFFLRSLASLTAKIEWSF